MSTSCLIERLRQTRFKVDSFHLLQFTMSFLLRNLPVRNDKYRVRVSDCWQPMSNCNHCSLRRYLVDAACTARSESVSRADAASLSNSKWGFRIRTLAISIRWRRTLENCTPREPHRVSKPPGSDRMKSMAFA
jgi:hypothetical protein